MSEQNNSRLRQIIKTNIQNAGLGDNCVNTMSSLSHYFMSMYVSVNAQLFFFFFFSFLPVFAGGGAIHYHLMTRSAVSLSARLPAHLLFVLCKGLWVDAFFKTNALWGM